MAGRGVEVLTRPHPAGRLLLAVEAAAKERSSILMMVLADLWKPPPPTNTQTNMKQYEPSWRVYPHTPERPDHSHKSNTNVGLWWIYSRLLQPVVVVCVCMRRSWRWAKNTKITDGVVEKLLVNESHCIVSTIV